MQRASSGSGADLLKVNVAATVRVGFSHERLELIGRHLHLERLDQPTELLDAHSTAAILVELDKGDSQLCRGELCVNSWSQRVP